MPTQNHRAAARLAAGVMTLALMTGCLAHAGIEQRELNPAELAVQVLPGEQSVSIRMAQTCKPVGLLGRFTTEYDIRVAAVQAGGNTAQIINESSYHSSQNGQVTASFAAQDVRFWACPVAGPPPAAEPAAAPAPAE